MSVIVKPVILIGKYTFGGATPFEFPQSVWRHAYAIVRPCLRDV